MIFAMNVYEPSTSGHASSFQNVFTWNNGKNKSSLQNSTVLFSPRGEAV